jgi:hypothetical protein
MLGVPLRFVVRLPPEAGGLIFGFAAAVGIVDAARRDGGAPLVLRVLPAIGVLGERRSCEHGAEGGKQQKPCHFHFLPDRPFGSALGLAGELVVI